MSRAARRRGARHGGSGRGKPGNRTPFIIMGGSVLAAILVVALIAGPARGGHHPEPRPDAAQAQVMSADRYASNPGVAEVYAMAAQIPHVMDGLFCHCLCAQNIGHYSLLDCFRGDHGAGCDICLDEAITAYQMTEQGSSLDEVRAEIDRRYRT